MRRINKTEDPGPTCTLKICGFDNAINRVLTVELVLACIILKERIEEYKQQPKGDYLDFKTSRLVTVIQLHASSRILFFFFFTKSCFGNNKGII